MPIELQQLKNRVEELHRELARQILEHSHDGNQASQIKQHDIFGKVSEVIATPATIATTGNTDWYVITPFDGLLFSVDFSATDALATNDTNYITFTITNLGQSGSGTTAMLDAVNDNTTKATGGSAISANTKRSLIVGVGRGVERGDRLRIRAAATGTLANSVSFPVYMLRFS